MKKENRRNKITENIRKPQSRRASSHLSGDSAFSVLGSKQRQPSMSAEHQTPKKKTKRNNYVNGGDQSVKVDFISRLPDDILVYLLSFVEMKTAGKTSLLSKRWRHVWTHLMDLDFDEPETLYLLPYKEALQSETGKYNKGVNKVITSSRAPFLNTFRIHFPLCGSYIVDIDKWVEFALSKKVRNLKLNLSSTGGLSMADGYTIRRDFLLSQSAHHHNTTLKCLHLEALSVEGPVLEYFLSNCVNLEQLTVRTCCFYSSSMLRFLPVEKLLISSVKLKHLELSRCGNIKSFQISAPGLTSFICFERKQLKVEYCSVPQLVSATFGGSYSYHIFHDLGVLSKFSDQLERLSLHWNQECPAPTRFPAFAKVKQLEFTVADPTNGDDKLLALISFIQACPLLHSFKLELKRWTLPGVQMSALKNVQIRAIRAHQHLKAVEFVGFTGSSSSAELALCLTHHAPMLKKFTFDPRSPLLMRCLDKFYYSEIIDKIRLARREEEFLARSEAELLAQRIPHRVAVVIL